jgi:hypothetical protein
MRFNDVRRVCNEVHCLPALADEKRLENLIDDFHFEKDEHKPRLQTYANFMGFLFLENHKIESLSDYKRTATALTHLRNRFDFNRRTECECPSCAPKCHWLFKSLIN